MTEVWRVTEEEDLDVKDVDKAIQESGTVPMGPVLPQPTCSGSTPRSTWPSTCTTRTAASASGCRSA